LLKNKSIIIGVDLLNLKNFVRTNASVIFFYNSSFFLSLRRQTENSSHGASNKFSFFLSFFLSF
jgi:hypothetical protein